DEVGYRQGQGVRNQGMLELECVAHLELIEEDVDPPPVSRVVVDQPLAHVEFIEHLPRPVTKRLHDLHYALRSLPPPHQVDVLVLAAELGFVGAPAERVECKASQYPEPNSLSLASIDYLCRGGKRLRGNDDRESLKCGRFSVKSLIYALF